MQELMDLVLVDGPIWKMNIRMNSMIRINNHKLEKSLVEVLAQTNFSCAEEYISACVREDASLLRKNKKLSKLLR